MDPCGIPWGMVSGIVITVVSMCIMGHGGIVVTIKSDVVEGVGHVGYLCEYMPQWETNNCLGKYKDFGVGSRNLRHA